MNNISSIYLVKSEKIPGKVLLMTIFAAFFYDIKCVNAALSSGGEEESGIMALLYMVGVVGIFGLAVLTNARCFMRIPKSAAIILATCCSLYFITTSFVGEPRISFVFFAILTIAAFLTPFLACIDVRLFMKCAMFFSFPALAKLDEVFAITKVYADAISMGMSYAFLSPIIITIVYLFTYYREETSFQRLLTIIGACANFVFAFFLISMGSRGPVLSILITIVFLLTVSYNHKMGCIEINKKRMLFFILAGLSIYMLFIPFMYFLQTMLHEMGLSFHFVDKMLFLQETMDLSNNRGEVVAIAWSDILNRPLLGYGLDRFEAHHPDYPYPHNSILQILFDGGIFLLFIILVPLVKSIKRKLKYCSFSEFVLLTSLFFASVPGSMFSGDLWRTMPLWIFFGAVLSKTFIYNNDEI